MKTQLLFAAALLLSGASFAQDVKAKQATTVTTTTKSATVNGSTQATVSTDGVAKTGKKVKKTVKNTANTTVQTGNQVKTETGAAAQKTSGALKTEVKSTNSAVKHTATVTSNSAVKAGSDVKATVKPKPVKVKTQVNTSGAIKL